jgi:predicted MFS family arabinose efflux permease
MATTAHESSRCAQPAHAALRDSPHLVVATIAASVLSLLGLNTMPLWIGPLIDAFAMGEEAAGLLGSVETGAMFLASVGVAGAMARWSRSRTALVGVALAVAGQAFSATTDIYGELVIGRFVAGAGEGLLMAAGSAAVAASVDPDRLFARITFVGGFLVAPVLFALPRATEPYGPAGAFATLSAVSVLFAAFLVWLPPPRAGEESMPTLRGAPNFWLALPIMLSLFVLETGQGAVWAFTAPVGEAAGLSPEGVGDTLSVTTVVGLSGAAFAMWLGTRYGRMLPLIVGIALNVGASLGLLLVREPFAFVAFNLLWVTAFLFVTPYIMGALAALDDLGRWTAAGAGFYTLGDAFAPWVGGLVLGRGSFGMLALLALGTGCVALVLLLPVLRRMGDLPAPGQAALEAPAPSAQL